MEWEVLLTCENVKKMQMKKEIQFIFERCDVKTNEDEDDDSLKILLLKLFCFSCGVSFHRRFIIFHFFYLLLDGLRSNGRLNNFINTPIKRGGWRRRGEILEKSQIEPERYFGWLKWKKAPKIIEIYILLPIFSLHCCFFDASFVFIRTFDKQFFFSLIYYYNTFFGSSCFWSL